MALMLNFELFYEHVDVSETRLQKKESISNVGTIFTSFWRFSQKKKMENIFNWYETFWKTFFMAYRRFWLKKNIFSPWAQFRPRTKYYSIWFWTFQKQFCNWRVLELNFCMHIDVAETRPQEKKWELIPRPEIIFTSFQGNFLKNS